MGRDIVKFACVVPVCVCLNRCACVFSLHFFSSQPSADVQRAQSRDVGADEATVLLGGAVKCLSAHATMLEFAEAWLAVVSME